MKTRSGFVSNSSSSSFIIAFDEYPDHIHGLHKLLFGTEEDILVKAFESDKGVSSYIVAQFIYTDLNNQHYGTFGGIERLNLEGTMGKLKKHEILSAILTGCFPGYPPFCFAAESKETNKIKDAALNAGSKNPYIDEPWASRIRKIENRYNKEHDKKVTSKAKEVLERFLSKTEGKLIYVFEYSDNLGSIGSMIEHGDVFKKLKHLKISHH